MKQKHLILLSSVTVVVVVAATMARRESGAAAEHHRQGKVLEGFLDRINDAAVVEVTRSGAEPIEVRRQGDTWTVRELGGYPAKFDKVKGALMHLAELEVAEQKTSDPARYADLGVQEPEEATGDGAAGGPTRVVVKDAEGATLAALVLGERKPGRVQQVYVRRVGEAPSYLATGQVTLPRDWKGWVDPQALNLAGDRVSSVTVRHADGEVLRVERVKRGEPNFEVEAVPEGRELTAPTAANYMSNTLSYLTFDKVRPAAEVDFSTPEAVTELRTWSGLVVVAEVAQAEGTPWVRLVARYEEPPAPAAEEEHAHDAEEEGEHADGEHADHDHGSHDGAEAELPSADEVRKEVEELNAKLAGWAFTFPAYKQSNLTKRMEDLLAPLEGEVEDLDAALRDSGLMLGDTQLDGSAPEETSVEEAAPVEEDGEGDEPTPDTPEDQGEGL